MFRVSSAGVLTSMALVKLLFIISCGSLMIVTESLAKSSDLEIGKTVEDRSIDGDLNEVDFASSGGIAKASTSHSSGNYNASKAFVGSSYWHSGSPYTVLPQFLWVEFPKPISIVKYSFTSCPCIYFETDGPSKYIFWASNGRDCRDESKWVILKEDMSGAKFSRNVPKSEITDNKKSYRCYGFKVIDVPGRDGQKIANIANVHFYIKDPHSIACVDSSSKCREWEKSAKCNKRHVFDKCRSSCHCGEGSHPACTDYKKRKCARLAAKGRCSEMKVYTKCKDSCYCDNTKMGLNEINFSLPKTGQTWSVHGDGTADKAFFNSSKFWHTGVGPPQALWISFGNPVSVKKFSFQSRTDSSSIYYMPDKDGPSKYVFFGSNSVDCSDSSSWTTLFEDTTGTPFTTANTPKTELVSDGRSWRSFTCYGFNVKDVPGRSNVHKIITMANIKLYTTGLQEMDLNSIGVGATSKFQDTEGPENAFAIGGNHWQSALGTQTPQAIWYKFPAPKVIAKFSFRSRNDANVINCGPTSYEFFGSNSTDCSDQSTWVNLFQDLSDTPFTTENIPKAEYVSSPAPYLCYGFKVLSITSQYGACMTNIRFFSLLE